MKRIRRILCAALAVLLVSQLFAFQTAAAAELITVDGTTVYADWTQKEVTAAFGSPRLVTPSAFGGTASTYYGSNYSKFLYIETDAAGRIDAYCTFTPHYKTPNNSYGDKKGAYIVPLMGELATDFDTGTIWAGCYYNCSFDLFSQYTATWKADPDKYLAGLQKQSALMMTALAKVLENKDMSPSFDEALFKANSALKEQGSDLYEYADTTGKAQYVQLIAKGAESLIEYSHMPNPLMYAQYARRYTAKANMTYGCFDFSFGENAGGGSSAIYFVDPAILKTGTTVEMTDGEAALLEQARAIYRQAVADNNAAMADGSCFATDYQYETCPLTAGVLKPGVLKGALGYINAIRAGAGLPLLSLSQELCSGAQAKAVLTRYLAFNGISNPNPHYPPQPDGVPDEFYALSGNGSGENLYMAGMLGADSVIGSIGYALQEAYGDVIACGHRYNLLDPDWASIGFGVCRGQGVHKMSGSQSNAVDMVAWPSKGIMLTDTNYTPARWTVQFYRGSYQTTAETTVSIKNLSTGTTWVITPADDLERVGTSLISYKDSTVTYSDGDIFQFTVSNLLKNGSPATYTYRTVFARANAAIGSGAGTLKGTVTLRENNANETVKIGVYDADNREIAFATVTGNGARAYEMTGLPVGIYTLRATAGGEVVGEYTVAVIKEVTVKNIEVSLFKPIPGFPFTDVPNNAYYTAAVIWALDKKITSGTSATTFSPYGSCTREQAVTFLWHACGSPAPKSTAMPFKDVPAGSYYYKAVLWSVEKGIIAGTSQTTFSPKMNCSRAQIVTLLWRLDGFKTTAAVNPFLDVKDGSYYAKAVLWAVGCGLTSGTSATTFSPDANCTRSQIVTFLYRYMQ